MQAKNDAVHVQEVPLFVLFFIVFFGCVLAESENETSERPRSASHKIVGNNVIDGTGKEYGIVFESTSDGRGDRKGNFSKVSVPTIALFALAMAAATGLGAVPFSFVERGPQWAGLCNGIAAECCLLLALTLQWKGRAMVMFLELYGEVSMLDRKGADATKVVLVIEIMTLHSFGEGSGVGVSFAGSKGFS